MGPLSRVCVCVCCESATGFFFSGQQQAREKETASRKKKLALRRRRKRGRNQREALLSLSLSLSRVTTSFEIIYPYNANAADAANLSAIIYIPRRSRIVAAFLFFSFYCYRLHIYIRVAGRRKFPYISCAISQ